MTVPRPEIWGHVPLSPVDMPLKGTQNAKPKQTQKRNLKTKPTSKFKNCSHVCVYHCAQLVHNTA